LCSTLSKKEGDLRMTDYKYDVTFYLEEDEAEAFEKYREEKGCCLVRGVWLLSESF
jgi:hypothetical protein